jgi:hypothetical protein
LNRAPAPTIKYAAEIYRPSPHHPIDPPSSPV